MTEIIFRSSDDAKKCYDHLLECLKLAIENEAILLFEDQHIVKIREAYPSAEFLDQVKNAFFEFIVKVKREDWFKEILMDHYYYQDPLEQQQIIEMIYSILEGEREDLAVFLEETNEEPRIREAVEQIFQNQLPVSFDSFVKFRLRCYMQVLENYVKISIDEYKMEQEYQMFVQTLREFLSGREPVIRILHLLLDEEIAFYNESFQEIKRGELTRMIDRKLLVNHPVYVDSASIAPLLSIAPIEIYLYTEDPEKPLVRTIKNIFEERVSIRPFQAMAKLLKWLNKNMPKNGA